MDDKLPDLREAAPLNLEFPEKGIFLDLIVGHHRNYLNATLLHLSRRMG